MGSLGDSKIWSSGVGDVEFRRLGDQEIKRSRVGEVWRSGV